MTSRSLLSLILFVCLGATVPAPSSAGAAPVESRRHQPVTRIDYPGYGIQVARLSGDQRKLEGTPRSFRRFVRARLDVLFEEAGSKPRCATSPTVVVDRYDGRGWAKAGEGWYGKCPAGGYAVIYDKTASGWRQILGSQEVRFCQDLAWYGVPRFIAGARCLTEDLAAVSYRTHDDTTLSPEATARRAISIISGVPVLPEAKVILPRALTQLQALSDKGAYVTVDECVVAGDGSPLAVHLGDAPYGCAVTATYTKGDKGTTESVMFRMRPDGDDLLVTELHPFA
jgi:hypothetical protein